MNEKRVGFGMRLGAAVLDMVLSGVAAVVILVVFATTGGVGLGLRYQEITGGRVSLVSFVDGSFARQIEDRSIQLTQELERTFTSRFTPAQAGAMGEVVGREMERMFLPAEIERGALWPVIRRFATIDSGTLDEALDRAFEAVEREQIEGVTAADLAAVRTELDGFLREMGITEFLPDVIRYAITVAVTPILGLLLYGLVEAFVGASVGKLLMGLRIGDLEGRRASMGITVARYLVKSGGPILILVAILVREPLILPFAALEYLVIFFGALAMLGSEKRALHDYMVQTAVYRSSDMAERV